MSIQVVRAWQFVVRETSDKSRRISSQVNTWYTVERYPVPSAAANMGANRHDAGPAWRADRTKVVRYVWRDCQGARLANPLQPSATSIRQLSDAVSVRCSDRHENRVSRPRGARLAPPDTVHG
jgi:hypothetical protein